MGVEICKRISRIGKSEMKIDEIKAAYPKMNPRWIVWKQICGEGLPNYKFMSWTGEKMREFKLKKYGEITDHTTEQDQIDFDIWLASLTDGLEGLNEKL